MRFSRLLLSLFLLAACSTRVPLDGEKLEATRRIVEQKLKASEDRFDVKCWTSVKNISNVLFGFQTDDRAFHLRESLILEFTLVVWKYTQDLHRGSALLTKADVDSTFKSIGHVRFTEKDGGVEVRVPEGQAGMQLAPFFVSDLDLFDYRRTSNSWKTLFDAASIKARPIGIHADFTEEGIDRMAWYIDMYALTLIKLSISRAVLDQSSIVLEKHHKRSDRALFINAQIDGWSPGQKYVARAFAQALAYSQTKASSLRHVNGVNSEDQILKTLSIIAGAELDSEGFRAYRSILKEFTEDLWRQAMAATPKDHVLLSGFTMYDVIMRTMPYEIDDLSNVIFYPRSEQPRLYQEFEGDTVRDDAYQWVIITELLEEKGRQQESHGKTTRLVALDINAAEELTELISSYAVPLLKNAATLAKNKKITPQSLRQAHEELLAHAKKFPSAPKTSNARHPIAEQGWKTPLYKEQSEAWGIKPFNNPTYLEDKDMREATLMAFDAFRGVATGDLNADGRPDVFVAHEGGDNRLYINTGKSLVESSSAWGVPKLKGVTGAQFVDYNNDGCVDLFLVRPYLEQVLLKNNCQGTLVNVTRQVGLTRDNVPTTGAIWFDHDNDGLLDLYQLSTGDFRKGFLPMFGDFQNAEPNLLWKQGKDGKFVEIGAKAGVADKRITLAAAAFDADNDGDLDLYLVNDMQRNILLQNDGKGTFKDVSRSSRTDDIGSGMGVSVADVDADGRLDLYLTNIATWNPRNRYIRPDRTTRVKSDADVDRNLRGRQANRLYLNKGKLTFEDQHTKLLPGYDRTSWGWNNYFFDADNDGDSDLMALNGFRPESIAHHDEENFLIARSSPNGIWGIVEGVKSGVGLFANSRGGVHFDIDADGDQDLLVTGLHSPKLYLNAGTPTDRHWLNVATRGSKTNRDGFGARVTVIRENGRMTLQQGNQGGGFISAINLPLHFGLGSSKSVTVEVVWPSGKTQKLADVAANQTLLVVEP